MNIVYAGNQNVFDGLLISVLSIIEQNKDALCVYVLTMDLKELDEKYVAVNQQMAARLPSARLEIVPGAGHTAHLEQPAQFISSLRGFLALVQ